MKRLALILVATLVPAKLVASVIPESKAVLAIVGEAGSESFKVQVAVADVIRHRGSLHGVYGWKNPVATKATPSVVARARRAWRASRTLEIVPGIKYFGCDSDIPYFTHVLKLHPVLKLGAITFYQ